MVLVIYLCLHYKLNPFKHSKVNHMETVCMFLLILCLATVVFDFQDQYPQLTSAIMAFIVLIPLILFIVFCSLEIRSYFIFQRKGNKGNSTTKYNDSEDADTFKETQLKTHIELSPTNETETNSNGEHKELNPINNETTNFKK